MFVFLSRIRVNGKQVSEEDIITKTGVFVLIRAFFNCLDDDWREGSALRALVETPRRTG